MNCIMQMKERVQINVFMYVWCVPKLKKKIKISTY